jgi:hypothetical protein
MGVCRPKSRRIHGLDAGHRLGLGERDLRPVAMAKKAKEEAKEG